MIPLPNRRDAFRTAAGTAAALLAGPSFVGAADDKDKEKDKPAFELPKLPYAFDALEPHIDAKTMEIHHDKHHQAYVDNLNKALRQDTARAGSGKPVEEILATLNKLPEECGRPSGTTAAGTATTRCSGR